MGIYSTVTLTKQQVIEAIKKRFPNLEGMSMPRLVEILEAMVQQREYDQTEDIYKYNNFFDEEPAEMEGETPNHESCGHCDGHWHFYSEWPDGKTLIVCGVCGHRKFRTNEQIW